MNLRKHLPIYAALLLLLTGSVQAQTKKATTGSYQLQKGRFIIGNTVLSFAPTKSKFRNYDVNGLLTSRSENKSNAFQLFFHGPDWGNTFFSSSKGTGYTGSNVQSSASESSGYAIVISPSIGYFIKDRLLIGSTLLLFTNNGKNENSNQNNTNSNLNKGTSFGFGPEIRYYFGGNEKRQFPFAGVSSLLQTGKNISESKGGNSSSHSENKASGYTITPYAGYSWLPGKRWLIEPALQARFSDFNSKAESTITNGNNTTTNKSSGKQKTTSVIGLRVNISFAIN